MSVVRLMSPNISCQHCAMTIRRELAAVDGVRVVDIDVPAKVVLLEYASDEALQQAKSVLAEIGYPVQALV